MSLLPRSLWESSTAARSAVWANPEGIAEVILGIVSAAVGSFAEELVFRGYLIARFERLFSSTGVAVIITTALFASFHCYYGAIGVISAAIMGLAYGISFCCCRRLWPVCVAHTIHNLFAMLS